MDGSRESRIHIVVWSKCRFAREALAAYLSGQPRFLVVGHTATVEGLQQLCALTRPQVAVAEVAQLTLPTVTALAKVRSSHPVDAVVLYTSLTPEVFAQAAEAGITSFVPASAGLEAVARIVRYQARQRESPPPAGDGQALTDRELAIVSLMTAGHTKGDIADLLRISPHTVDNHRRRIYTKLGVGNQSAAVARAISLGMVPWPWIASATEPHRYGSVPLTTREQEILSHIALGHTTRQTARALGIAAKTVENTQARLYRKLGTHNRGETLAVAYRLGLVESIAHS
jgi:DNA-binding NarL/FixJ family response regulator